MEHLQSEEPFSSDPYFRDTILLTICNLITSDHSQIRISIGPRIKHRDKQQRAQGGQPIPTAAASSAKSADQFIFISLIFIFMTLLISHIHLRTSSILSIPLCLSGSFTPSRTRQETLKIYSRLDNIDYRAIKFSADFCNLTLLRFLPACLLPYLDTVQKICKKNPTNYK